jgi:hypothetical protein
MIGGLEVTTATGTPTMIVIACVAARKHLGRPWSPSRPARFTSITWTQRKRRGSGPPIAATSLRHGSPPWRGQAGSVDDSRRSGRFRVAVPVRFVQTVGVIASVQPWACDQAPCTGSGRVGGHHLHARPHWPGCRAGAGRSADGHCHCHCRLRRIILASRQP